MAITAITINQDNIYNGSLLMPIHSPLSFIATVTYTGDAPDNITVKILDADAVPLSTHSAIYLDDISVTERRFIFFADSAIRALMDSYEDDLFSLVETLSEVEKIYKPLLIDFTDAIITARITVVAIHGAAQFGNYPNLTHIHDNAEKNYYGKKDGFAYIYFYATGVSTTVDITDNGVLKGTFSTPNVGIYRYKTNADVSKQIIFDNGISAKTQNLIVIDECEGILLKWLNFDGQYVFYPFNRFYETRDSATTIGKTSDLITDIYTSQSEGRTVGRSTVRTISLTADNVTADALTHLSSLYSSPCVYMKIGTTDTAKDWIRVEIQGDAIVRRRKFNSGQVSLVATLPERYNITLL